MSICRCTRGIVMRGRGRVGEGGGRRRRRRRLGRASWALLPARAQRGGRPWGERSLRWPASCTMHPGLVAVLSAVVALSIARPLDRELADASDLAVRSERSTNLSHMTGTARKIQMFIRHRHLQILPDGSVNGTTDDLSAYSEYRVGALLYSYHIQIRFRGRISFRSRRLVLLLTVLRQDSFLIRIQWPTKLATTAVACRPRASRNPRSVM